MDFSPNKKKGKSGSRRGFVFVLVLIIVTSVSVLAVGMAYRTRMEIKLAGAYARKAQAYYLALGGIERAKALLEEKRASVSDMGVLSGFHSSAEEEGLFERLPDSKLVQGLSLEYSLRDEQSLFNINKSDPACWHKLGVISQGCADGIVDWIDEDSDTSPSGAETDFYQRLEHAYRAKNKAMTSLRELLYVKGVTPGLYLGEDLNRDLNLDENERDGALRPPSDNADNKLDLGLLDFFTVYGDGKININTAAAMILAALPGIDEEAAAAVIAHRYGPDGRDGTDDDAFLAGKEQIADIDGLTELQVELLQQYCCFESKYMRVFSNATVGDITCCMMATIIIEENKARVVSLEKLL